MPSTRRLLARALVVSTLAVSALTVTTSPPAVAVVSHEPLNDTRPVGAAPVQVDFPIQYFGLVADLPTASSRLPDRGRTPYGEARFHVGGHWTAWHVLDRDGAQAPGQFTAALVSVDDADAYQVRGLPAGGSNWRAAAINTTDGPSVVVGHTRPGAAVASPACRSRADWGADESRTGWSRGTDVQAFSPVQVVTVHHTAGSNDLGQDYAATVRAIYDYHVETNKWADIGYQYLVDAHGVVYEGRSAGHTSRSCLYDGGDGSDFAHQTGTDDVVTGGHTANNNSGNLGISLMGCFEPASATCTGNTEPTAAAMRTLDAEVAALSARHQLDPDGTTHYLNPVSGQTRDVRTISGHRDWNATECPGQTLYARLPSVRASTVAFSAGSRTVTERAGTVQLRVTRSGNTALPAAVDYAVTGGTATNDHDHPAGTLAFAAGQTTGTVPLAITDDATPEGAETVVLTLSNPANATVVGAPARTTLTIAPSDQRPDASVSTTAGSGYLGNNVYNATGYRQTRTVTARRTQTRTFYARIQNDGTIRNTFRVKGTAARAGSTVRYYSGSTNITTAMRSTGGWKVTVDRAAYRLVRVQVTVARGAAFGSLKPASVSATWTGDGSRTDLVRAVVKVTS